MKTTTKQTGRSCKCGYVFLNIATVRSRKFESFAVVSDKSYQRFLKAEVGVLHSVGEVAKARAIARASKLVGSLLECPDCGRFLVTMPGGNSEAFYLREDKA